jgi:hypothetical protein
MSMGPAIHASLQSKANLAVALIVLLLANSAVDGRKSPDTGPSFLQRMPKWAVSQAINQGFKRKDEPRIYLTNLAPGWSIIGEGPTITDRH